MTNDDRSSPEDRRPPATRDARRAEALRANLLRRKAQTRAKADIPENATPPQEQGDA
jgi:hypothetical protein